MLPERSSPVPLVNGAHGDVRKDIRYKLDGKLRTILLMEVDFNYGKRLLFGSCIVKDMKNKHVLPQDSFGSRKKLFFVEVAVCRALFF